MIPNFIDVWKNVIYRCIDRQDWNDISFTAYIEYLEMQNADVLWNMCFQQFVEVHCSPERFKQTWLTILRRIIQSWGFPS